MDESQLASAMRALEEAEDHVWLQAATAAINLKSEGKRRLPKRLAKQLERLSDSRFHALLELFELEVAKR